MTPSKKKHVAPIPDGYTAVTPYLCLKDPAAALDWYKKAFGAEVGMVMAGPGGHGVAHAEFKIGNAHLMMSGEWPGSSMKSPASMKGTTCAIHLYVENTDSSFERAVKAGAEVIMPPTDMFWGDRFSKLRDPFGHEWSISTHVEDVPEAEMPQRAEAAFKAMADHPKT